MRNTKTGADMYVYISKVVTRDGFSIQHVCATPEKAIELSMQAGHKHLLTGGPERMAGEKEVLVKQLLAGKEFYLADNPDCSGDLVLVSRYVVE